MMQMQKLVLKQLPTQTSTQNTSVLYPKLRKMACPQDISMHNAKHNPKLRILAHKP